MWQPLVWSLVMRRGVNLASNTLFADLHALKTLYAWGDENTIDIEERMVRGTGLCTAEFASLAKHFRSAIMRSRRNETSKERRGKVQVLALHAEVSRHTASNRMHVVAEYLAWLGETGCQNLTPQESAARTVTQKAMLARFTAMGPRQKGRNAIGAREGPPKDILDAILAAIQIGVAHNPWADLGLQVRNRLLIMLLYATGLRRGEALNVKIEDIDFRQGTLTVTRSADDVEDPRPYQPLAKTRDRILPVKEGLLRMLEDYVLRVRGKVPGARRHPFLIVSHQTGAPLSLAAANKVFRTLRSRVHGLPDNLTPHVLRHAWNDAFSALADQRKISPEQEAQMRSAMMGWSPTSGLAATYTRRHAQEKASKASLAHQESLVGGEHQ